MVTREQCKDCSSFRYGPVKMFRLYIRKYDVHNKAKWYAVGWYCEKCGIVKIG